MKEKNKGVQARILNENARAFFFPCGCHSLKLLLFSASVNCWKILTDHANVTVQPVCERHWEWRLDRIKLFDAKQLKSKIPSSHWLNWIKQEEAVAA